MRRRRQQQEQEQVEIEVSGPSQLLRPAQVREPTSELQPHRPVAGPEAGEDAERARRQHIAAYREREHIWRLGNRSLVEVAAEQGLDGE
jgi:hypothetical protein